jgi:hypothetical protein
VNKTLLETYFSELSEIRSSGAASKETSGYGQLETLFNALGQSLKPRVRCIIQLKNSGAGIPDGGFFTPDQLKNPDTDQPLYGQKPARGVIEVKAPSEDLEAVAVTKQLRDYLKHYGQVLLTNYRQFRLLKIAPDGKVLSLEPFNLAETEQDFWKLAAHPRSAPLDLSERFTEYLKRVLLHAAPLNNPRDVAFFLASYARDAHVRVEKAGDLPALTAIRTALEEALGMKFEQEKGEHFFRSTLVQTIFYGVFSAWVLWHKENPLRNDPFDWKAAAWTLHVPMIKALFEQVANPSQLRPLGLVEVLDWTAAALNRVDRSAFFNNFVESHAVQYFYEPFLEAFDPELRKQLGVWYTPPEIVQYMVARVDTVLREELDIPDGLADPRVFVLDPCCGTGAYLVEVLNKIADTLKTQKGEDALAWSEIKEAAQNRVFGFELLPAPFVVAHLQLGLLLHNLGVPLNETKNERAGIFLTNALTGWDFAGENPKLANWPELEAERRGAGKVKQEKPILVILGNPPYNAYAGISPEEENGLVEPYKQGLVTDWKIKKFNLDDLYVRFFRVAERRIAEKTGSGIVCFISNFSYLADPSFVVLRQRFLSEFDSLWFDCLNGDSRETGKLTPDGEPDPSVFSTDYNREGIRVGTTIGLLVRKPTRNNTPTAQFRQFWGVNKRSELLDSLHHRKAAYRYSKLSPNAKNRFSFSPSTVTKEYSAWPSILGFCAEPPSNGLMEKRAGALIDFDRAVLEARMRRYYDPKVDWDALRALRTGLTEDAARFDARKARAKVTSAENFQPAHLRRYALRPFDTRWCYYSSERPLWNEPRPRLWQQCWPGNSFLLTRMNCPRSPEGAPMSFTQNLCDDHSLTPDAVAIPLLLRAKRKTKPPKDDGNGEFGLILKEAAAAYGSEDNKTTGNLSPTIRAYLSGLGINNPDSEHFTAVAIWMHCLAIGFSPAYLHENADGIRADWPRVPLPSSRQNLIVSAKLGRRVADLLDTEQKMAGIDLGKIAPNLVTIAVVARLSKATLNLSITAGWGHAGQNRITMPGKGKLQTRSYSPDEQLAPEHLPLLGPTTCDVYLNDTTCWKNIPINVWEYTIGGYQVLKKWLSYREFELLGRALTPDEAREVTHIARRIAALVLLQPELDKNYQTIKSDTASWSDFKTNS